VRAPVTVLETVEKTKSKMKVYNFQEIPRLSGRGQRRHILVLSLQLYIINCGAGIKTKNPDKKNGQ
jgi:hypothetical protein